MIKWLGLSAFILAAAGAAAAQDTERLKGETLYQENCASCHGANLEGQPDWRARLPNGRLPAPPHDASGHTWHHADRVLVDIITRGTAAIVGSGYESDMPGFGDTLSREDIEAILDYIKSRWPDRERAAQEEITRADIEAGQ